MTEIRRFTDAALEEAERIASARYARHRGLGWSQAFSAGWHQKNPELYKKIRVNTWGLLGEWAVADSLGYPRSRDASGKTDDGWNLRLDQGRTIEVRYVSMRGGGFLVNPKEVFRADWGVLTSAHGRSRNEVEIVGAFSICEYEDLRRATDLGYGSRWIVWPGDMVPWEPFRDYFRRTSAA